MEESKVRKEGRNKKEREKLVCGRDDLSTYKHKHPVQGKAARHNHNNPIFQPHLVTRRPKQTNNLSQT